MLKRPEQILKLLCLLLAAALGLEVARVAAKGKPLKSLAIPALPTFVATKDSTNSATAQTNKGTDGVSGANVSSSTKGETNLTTAKAEAKGTNKPNDAAKSETNATKVAEAKDTKDTNKSAIGAEAIKSNAVAGSSSSTNSAETNFGYVTVTNGSAVNTAKGTNGTNTARDVTDKSGTNAIASGSSTNKTNSLGKIGGAGTNSQVAQTTSTKGPGTGGRLEMGKKGPDVPPAMKARIDRITQSEILAPVMHPMPMALLGIGGDEALIRSPEGQTGMLKEGKELGSIKLLKIGTNRVLIEEKGEKKELTIFSGFGGESLMPKAEKKAEEAKKDAKLEPKKTEEKDKKPDEPTKKSA